MSKFTLFIVLFFFFSACKNASYVNTEDWINPELKYATPAKLGELQKPSKPFRIINAYIDENLLYIQVEYKASCSGNESFEFIGGDLFFDEKNRYAREAKLFIKNSGETCSLRNETLIFDIKTLTSVEEKDAEVVLHIDGWRTKMTYVFHP
jgi:hypothetical protein